MTVIQATFLLVVSATYVALSVIDTPAAEASAWAYALVAAVTIATYHLGVCFRARPPR